MSEKEPENVSVLVQAIPFLFAIMLSCIGGLVSYLNRMNRDGFAFSFFRLSVEIVTSGFVGIVVFMLCDAAELGWSYTAAIVAISGHMGARALFLLENMALKPFLRRYGYEDSKEQICGEEMRAKRSKKPNERV